MNTVVNSLVDFFAKHKVVIASLATITEDGKPWVRYVSVSLDRKEMTIKFATFTESRKVRHIAKNSYVHLCCGVINNEAMPEQYFQIEGSATVTTDQQERDASWNSELAAYFKGPNDPNYAVFIIKPLRIELSLAGELEPHVWSAQ